MKDDLKALVGKDLVFIDEYQKKIEGSLMYIENPLGLDDRLRDYFFIPYNEKSPFKISSKVPNKICVSTGHKLIYGNSDDLNNLASKEELNSLAQFEGIMRMSNHVAEVHGKGNSCLIKCSDEEHTKNLGEIKFPEWVSGF